MLQQRRSWRRRCVRLARKTMTHHLYCECNVMAVLEWHKRQEMFRVSLLPVHTTSADASTFLMLTVSAPCRLRIVCLNQNDWMSNQLVVCPFYRIKCLSHLEHILFFDSPQSSNLEGCGLSKNRICCDTI